MYEHFFGLRERPFDLTPNPRYLLTTRQHNEALSTLRYGISARKGIVLLTGAAGTGKTTLIRVALAACHAETCEFVNLSNPRLTRVEFLEFLSNGFSLPRSRPISKCRVVTELIRLLEQRLVAGVRTVFVIDEAQALSDELLEEVRLLANIETDSVNLLSVVLAGQPELAQRLDSPAFRQLKQRVALRCNLGPLDINETAAYIGLRIRLAGGEAARVFTREAVQLIYEASGGVPRLINVVCDNALMTGFAADERPVTRSLIIEVCRDFDLAPSTSTGEPSERSPLTDSPRPHNDAPDGIASISGNHPPEGRDQPLFANVGGPRRFVFF